MDQSNVADGPENTLEDRLLDSPEQVLRSMICHVEEILNYKREMEEETSTEDPHQMFLNSEVMQKIFNVTTLETLRSCRLVSKLWWSASLDRCRENFRMHLLAHLQSERRDTKDYPYLIACRWNLSDHYHFSKFPIHKYEIVCGDLDNEINSQGQNLQSLWQTFGPSVKDLKIMDLGNAGASIAIWVTLLEHFPNIENLEVENIESRSQANITHNNNSPYQQLNKILFAIQILKKKLQNGRPAITGLNILNARKDAIFHLVNLTLQRFDQLRLPLTSLSMDLGISSRKRGLKLLLEYHAATLQKVVLYRAPFKQPYYNFQFGVMLESLRELGLFGPICENLLFLKYTPNLKVLKLIDDSGFNKPWPLPSEAPVIRFIVESRDYDEVADELIRQSAQLRTIRDPYPVIGFTNFEHLENIVLDSLEVFISGNEACTKENVEGLAILMPKLRQLQIGIWNKDGFKAVCNSWSYLDKLELTLLRNFNAEDFEAIIPHGEIRIAWKLIRT
ncbi:unnamed protein product [Orchesella dallaii]|uniref:F-box domain-containing protein n=1 Tax=Orchesella dallaii TaxID=48710 RepID=A0ABP1RPB5_9HEXA